MWKQALLLLSLGLMKSYPGYIHPSVKVVVSYFVKPKIIAPDEVNSSFHGASSENKSFSELSA